MRFLLFVFLALSCAHDGQSPNALTKIYERDLSIVVNGQSGRGTLVVPLAASYKITIQLPSKAETLIINNCHRWFKVEKSGWFNRTSHTFTYIPQDGIETKGFCPLKIAALDLDGENSWAIIEFVNRDLPATVLCNGSNVFSDGVSLCQSHIGLEQRILFDEPTDWEPAELDPAICSKLIPLTTMSGYKIQMSPETCVYHFLGLKSGKMHRLTTFGYDTFFYTTIKASNQ